MICIVIIIIIIIIIYYTTLLTIILVSKLYVFKINNFMSIIRKNNNISIYEPCVTFSWIQKWYRSDTHKADPAKSAVNSLQQNITLFGVIRVLSSRIIVCELSAVSTHLLMEEEGNDIRFTIKGFWSRGKIHYGVWLQQIPLIWNNIPRETTFSKLKCIKDYHSLTLMY